MREPAQPYALTGPHDGACRAARRSHVTADDYRQGASLRRCFRPSAKKASLVRVVALMVADDWVLPTAYNLSSQASTLPLPLTSIAPRGSNTNWPLRRSYT